jgi:dTDP-4-dehydrorhamnose 3,5-epimerase
MAGFAKKNFGGSEAFCANWRLDAGIMIRDNFPGLMGTGNSAYGRRFPIDARRIFKERNVIEKTPLHIAYADGLIDGVVIRPLKTYRDPRGWLVELFRQDEVAKESWPVMTYVSQTLPGVARGPHEHVDQTDGFAFLGPSDFKLFMWDIRADSATQGRRTVLTVGASNPTAVWIPPGVVHAYRNVGDVPGLVFNAPNRLYAGWGKKEPVDEIRHEEDDPARFPMD